MRAGGAESTTPKSGGRFKGNWGVIKKAEAAAAPFRQKKPRPSAEDGADDQGKDSTEGQPPQWDASKWLTSLALVDVVIDALELPATDAFNRWVLTLGPNPSPSPSPKPSP